MIEVRSKSFNQDQKNHTYKKAIWITITGNALLAGGKSASAALTGSAALYADAANSVSDVLYSILVAVGLRIAMQPPDTSHPQGHSRFEPLVGLIVTAAMSIAAYEAGRNALDTFIQGAHVIPLDLASIVLLASALFKIIMYFLIRKLATASNSPTLTTIAKDNLTDVFASAAAFIGAAGTNFIHPLTDPIAGALVALWIFRSAWQSGKENLVFLTGGGASADIRDQIIHTAHTIPGVLDVHHIITEYVGPNLIVDMHINVDRSINFDQSHRINDAVIEALEAMPEVDRAYVHLEPEGWVDPKKKKSLIL